MATMKAHKARQATERLAAGPLWQDSGAVFAMEDGRPVATDYLTRLFGRKVIEAGLRVIALHCLRRAYATLSETCLRHDATEGGRANPGGEPAHRSRDAQHHLGRVRTRAAWR
jgi:hypothetical protein